MYHFVVETRESAFGFHTKKEAENFYEKLLGWGLVALIQVDRAQVQEEGLWLWKNFSQPRLLKQDLGEEWEEWED